MANHLEMIIIVTGASGFLGAALIDRLSSEPSLQLRAAVRERSRRPSEGIDTVVVGNIGGETDWRRALKGVDVVVHLAARVHVMKDSVVDPLAAFRATNRDGTLRLAEAMVREGCRRLVFVSTAKVMGEATMPGEPFTSDSRAAPADPYACSKWEAEQGLQTLQQSGSLECVVIRPPLVYGPGVGANFLAMMRWLDRRWPLPLGSVRNRRTLVAAANLTDLIAVCLDHPAAPGRVFLAGDAESLSTPDLLRRLGGALERPPRLFSVPDGALRLAATLSGRQQWYQRLCGSLQLDIGATCSTLGWSPPVSVDTALQATAASYRRMKR